MKKVRMILSAIAVFSVVGSALAFNVNRANTFCIRALANGAGVCENQITNKKIVTTGGTQFRGYQKTGATCAVNCNDIIRLDVD